MWKKKWIKNGCVSFAFKFLYSKTCVKRPLLKDHELAFKINYRYIQVKNIAECCKGNILQYFRPALSSHLSLRALFCLFLSGRYCISSYKIVMPHYSEWHLLSKGFVEQWILGGADLLEPSQLALYKETRFVWAFAVRHKLHVRAYIMSLAD